MSAATRRPRVLRWLAPTLVVVSLMLAGCGSTQQSPSAAEQVPRLEAVLHRVDAALADHHFGAALEQLRALKAEVVRARDTGDLRDADAERVLEAITGLVKLVPEPTATTSATTATTSTSHSPEPSKSATSKTHHSTTPTRTPVPTVSPSASATPSSTPSSSPTSSPDASPTSGATRDASPTGSPTPGP